MVMAHEWRVFRASLAESHENFFYWGFATQLSCALRR